MLEITLIPSLSHCIETTAIKEYNDTLRHLFTGNLNRYAQKLELLKNFLETADFRELRTKSEENLMNGKRVEFVLYSENGVTKYKMKVN